MHVEHHMNAQSVEHVVVDANGKFSLPPVVLRQVGWEAGDELWAEVLDNGALLLTRRR